MEDVKVQDCLVIIGTDGRIILILALNGKHGNVD
jgi:hypothetical protein